MPQGDYPTSGENQITPIENNGAISNPTIGASAAAILATPHLRRRTVSFQNLDATRTIFIGFTSAVTTSGATRGWQLGPGASLDIAAGESVTFFAIASSAGADLQALEL